MTGTLRAAVAFSVGAHAVVLAVWPAAAPVAFDVERAAMSLEVQLAAPRPRPAPAPVRAEPTASSEPPAPAPESKAEAEVSTPELRGALGEVLPDYLRNPAPRYPLLARERGQEGTVLLRVEVLSTGRCGGVETRFSSGYPLLDAAAAGAVRQWTFRPARRAGRPVAVWVELPITFRLLDDSGDWTMTSDERSR